MKGSVYKRCSCRDPQTRKPLGASCPDLRKARHGAWYYRVDMPTLREEKRRRPEYGPFDTKKLAEEDLAKVIARFGGGSREADRKLLVRDYLENWLAGMRLKLKPRTYQSYEEACRLYFIPGVGHLRLVELRDHHLQALVTAMRLINRPLDGDVPADILELHRRLQAVRADDVRRVLAEGEKRHKKSTTPLSPQRMERIFAVLSSALGTAIKTKRITDSPLVGVVFPAAVHPKPLAWTAPRVAKFWADLERATRDARDRAGGRALTAVERQDLWGSPALRPAPSMVWTAAHAGRFLDYLDESGERLAVLFIVTMFCGLRRDEVLGLTWAEIDLDEGVLYVRETASGDGPKSEAGTRAVPIPAPALEALRAWKKVQAADRLAWGPDWADARGLAFTREDGSALLGQWASQRFETLAYREGSLPPVRFHDLRHGTASLMKAAKADSKYIAAVLGHKKATFTDAHYVTLFTDVQKEAAEAAAALVPRRRKAQ